MIHIPSSVLKLPPLPVLRAFSRTKNRCNALNSVQMANMHQNLLLKDIFLRPGKYTFEWYKRKQKHGKHAQKKSKRCVYPKATPKSEKRRKQRLKKLNKDFMEGDWTKELPPARAIWNQVYQRYPRKRLDSVWKGKNILNIPIYVWKENMLPSPKQLGQNLLQQVYFHKFTFFQTIYLKSRNKKN